MVFPRKFQLLIVIFTFFIPILPLKAQIIFRDLTGYRINLSDSTFFESNQFRKITPLNGQWKVYRAGDTDKKETNVTVPSIFKGTGELVFEKNFSLSQFDLEGHQLRLVFLGVNYSAEISVNNKIIYTHTGGAFPFQVDLPRDILNTDRDNVLSVKVKYKLNSENTIPLKQRFLFPKDFGGIFRDVYIESRPNISFTNFSVADSFYSKTGKVKVSVLSRISNREFQSPTDTLTTINNLVLKSKIISPDGLNIQSPSDFSFELKKNKEININQSLELSNPALWMPETPRLYTLRLELWKDKNLIDVVERKFAVYSLSAGKDNLKLNGENLSLNGVTYIPSNRSYGSLFSYNDMEKDIKMIKDLGFNAVRFAKSIPHPYYLYLCEKYGLLAFIEIPLNGLPEKLANDPDVISRSKNYISNFIKAYGKYSIAGFGLGSSYLTNSEDQAVYLKNISSFVKGKINALTYASFSGFEVPEIDDLDFYGIELLNTSIKKEAKKLKGLQEKLGVGKVFISEATYLVYSGNSDGYLNPGSFEAQAKYFDDLIDFSNNNKLAGYFINSMFDYRGEYASIIAGYNSNNLYKLGICDENRSTDRIGYKIIYSKFHNTEKVTIPIGTRKDNAPISFILFGLLLAILMGVLVNSGKKFREDASRALLRPYNFFADVRDQRIMSGYHSVLLAVIIAAVGALVAANFLTYFRENLAVERVLLAFGNHALIKDISFLAWHSIASLFWLTILYMVLIIALTVIIKAVSFFVKNRVFFSSVFYSVVWSFLPLVLLIPVGIILYRILNADIANVYIYWGVIIFKLWIFYRLMKGIYVIFDVGAGSVYFYSILTVLLICGGLLFYFQMNDLVINYLHIAIKQFNIGA